MTNRFRPAPSIENMDGIACAAVAEFSTAQPFDLVHTEIEHDSSTIFEPLFVSDPNAPPPGPTPGVPSGDERFMVVEAENRVMVLEAPSNRMTVWRDNS
jgi:hypothetical protein